MSSVYKDGLHHASRPMSAYTFSDYTWWTACGLQMWRSAEHRRLYMSMHDVSEPEFLPYEGQWAGPEKLSEEPVDCIECLAAGQ